MKNQMSFLLKRNMRVLSLSIPVILIIVYLSTGSLFKTYPERFYGVNVEGHIANNFAGYFSGDVPYINLCMALFSLGLAILLFYKEKFQSADSIYYSFPVERKKLYLSNIITGASIIAAFSAINGVCALIGYNTHSAFLQSVGLGIDIVWAKIILDFFVYTAIFLICVLFISIINKLVSGLFLIFTAPLFLGLSTAGLITWAALRLFGNFIGNTQVFTDMNDNYNYYAHVPRDELLNIFGYNMISGVSTKLHRYAELSESTNISVMNVPFVFWKVIIMIAISVLVFLLSMKLLKKFKLENKSKLLTNKYIESIYKIIFTVSIASFPLISYLLGSSNISLLFADILFIVCLIGGFMLSSIFIMKSCAKKKLFGKREPKILIGSILVLIVIFISFKSYPFKSTSNIKDEILAFNTDIIEEVLTEESLKKKFNILNLDLPGKAQPKTVVLKDGVLSINYGGGVFNSFEEKYWKDDVYQSVVFNSIIYFTVLNDINRIDYVISTGNDRIKAEVKREQIEKAFEIDSKKMTNAMIENIKKILLDEVKIKSITNAIPTNTIKALYSLAYRNQDSNLDYQYNKEKNTITLYCDGEIYQYNGRKFPLEKVEVFYPSHIQEKLLDSKMNYVKSEGLEMKSGYKLEMEIKLDTTKLPEDEIRSMNIHDIVKKFVVNDSIDINY
jgi:hypothetical protein